VLHISYWLTLNCIVIIPIYLLIRHAWNIAFLPVVLYGLSLWAFLVVGLPLESENLGRGMNFSILYYLVIIAISLPLYGFAVLGMHRKIFPRTGLFIDISGAARSKAIVITFTLMWSVILCAVWLYSVKVGRPPIFDASIVELFGSAQDLKDIRKAYTYTAEFRFYKFFFYSAPPFAALVGYYLYLNKKIGLLTNLISIGAAMVLTVAFLHKQGPAFINLRIVPSAPLDKGNHLPQHGRRDTDWFLLSGRYILILLWHDQISYRIGIINPEEDIW